MTSGVSGSRITDRRACVAGPQLRPASRARPTSCSRGSWAVRSRRCRGRRRRSWWPGATSRTARTKVGLPMSATGSATTCAAAVRPSGIRCRIRTLGRAATRSYALTRCRPGRCGARAAGSPRSGVRTTDVTTREPLGIRHRTTVDPDYKPPATSSSNTARLSAGGAAFQNEL